MRWLKMSEEVYKRLEEIVPPTKLEDMDIIEVERDCKVAFKVIGYTPKHFEESFASAWRHSVSTMLFEFIFDVYMEDIKHE